MRVGETRDRDLVWLEGDPFGERFCPRLEVDLRPSPAAVGGSAGTNLWGALRLAAEMRRTNVRGSIVTLLCDSGERYGNTYYDDAWLRTRTASTSPRTR